MYSKFGNSECDQFALAPDTEKWIPLAYRVFWLKTKFDAMVNKDTKDIALVTSMMSDDGPYQYLKQIVGPIIKKQVE